ncbi:unnamed protein product [Acanthoscelides obtectus]|uniref:Uncharacterized protein n=1 Tax=Acanthoscelides obtectus TaxID=200917 RepID=A0A9P0KSA9_ACAOB|nr:unnamed protein product [Acanthoscelides obtectus]CAK1655944.1 hypothetical protein AOBTE_LOCUS19457 [Acanthoscelides obtectus]
MWSGLEQCCSEIINIVPVSVTHASRLEWVKKNTVSQQAFVILLQLWQQAM